MGVLRVKVVQDRTVGHPGRSARHPERSARHPERSAAILSAALSS
jgi:hypothetical protein